MIGVWCLTVWQQLGSPSKMRLVELGPGRGTLMADLLRGTAPFKPFISGLDVHLVEVSHIHSCNRLLPPMGRRSSIHVNASQKGTQTAIRLQLDTFELQFNFGPILSDSAPV